MCDMDLVDYWPLFGLEIRTPRLLLRVPRDADLVEALELIDNGIHDPAVMPFDIAWTDAEPPVRARNSLQYWWKDRANVTPESWGMGLFAYHDGELLGSQAIRAVNFITMREAETGSWLGKAHQRQGYGTEMRTAVLHFGFECLGAPRSKGIKPEHDALNHARMVVREG
jgi:RimJ/RimL family protein N-acetyltransferase